MSKYSPLWEYIGKKRTEAFTMTFDEIESIIGIKLDHSFLTYKNELSAYGFEVKKIHMKEKTVDFIKL